MRPLFGYYGSKYKLSRYYPAPNRDLVIEPFAGSACYSLYYNCPNVILYDTDPIIAGIWRFLIGATEQDILSLPLLPEVGDCVHDHALPQEAKHLVGHWLNFGPMAGARRTKTSSWSASIRQRIADTLPLIRGWQIHEKSFEEAPDVEATWMVDPPYVRMGKWYRHPFSRYTELGEWCRGRCGQVIACEGPGADWLPFSPLGVFRSATGRMASEFVWTRDDQLDRKVTVTVADQEPRALA